MILITKLIIPITTQLKAYSTINRPKNGYRFIQMSSPKVPLDGQTLPESWQKSKSEARNLPTWGCKSMAEGPTIMLGVFITLLYMYTMSNKHYSSKPTSLRYHLMAKRCLRVGRNPNMRQEICPHVALNV